MNEIRPLTVHDVLSSARRAAEQRVPHAEANHFEQGSEFWRVFFKAYLEAQEELEAA